MSRRFAHYLCIGLVIASMPAACVRRLPASPIPEPLVPAVAPATPVPQGRGRLIVDVVEGPTPVHLVTYEARPIERPSGLTSYRLSTAPQNLCSPSPCSADLPLGNVLVGFPMIGKDELETEIVNIGPDPSVYRRSLSVYEDHTGTERVLGIIFASVGAASAITGMALLPSGLAKDNSGLTTAGAITLGGGGLLLTLGILMIRHDAPTYRPGSSNHFPLAPTPSSAP